MYQVLYVYLHTEEQKHKNLRAKTITVFNVISILSDTSNRLKSGLRNAGSNKSLHTFLATRRLFCTSTHLFSCSEAHGVLNFLISEIFQERGKSFGEEGASAAWDQRPSSQKFSSKKLVVGG